MSLTKILAGLCLAAIILPASAEEKFKVCADPLNPPYSTKNKDGFENKIAELFAQELGQKVEYTWFAQRIGFIRNTLITVAMIALIHTNYRDCLCVAVYRYQVPPKPHLCHLALDSVSDTALSHSPLQKKDLHLQLHMNT